MIGWRDVHYFLGGRPEIFSLINHARFCTLLLQIGILSIWREHQSNLGFGKEDHLNAHDERNDKFCSQLSSWLSHLFRWCLSICSQQHTEFLAVRNTVGGHWLTSKTATHNMWEKNNKGWMGSPLLFVLTPLLFGLLPCPSWACIVIQ